SPPSLSLTLPPLRPPLFPYTTLFRSPGNAATHPSSRRSWTAFGYHAWDLDARVPALTGFWPTRHTARKPTGPCCASAASRPPSRDRKSTRLNSSHLGISYAVFCLKKK